MKTKTFVLLDLTNEDFPVAGVLLNVASTAQLRNSIKECVGTLWDVHNENVILPDINWVGAWEFPNTLPKLSICEAGEAQRYIFQLVQSEVFVV